MKILEDRYTPNSKRVRMFFAEKDVALPFEQINSSAAEYNSSDFTDIKSFHEVPALVLDTGARIADCFAICKYMEDLSPEPPVMGWDMPDRALVEMWNRRVEFHLFDFVFQPETQNLPGWGEIYRPKAEEAFEFLNTELENHEFIAGKSFSIVDITAYVALHELAKVNVVPSEDLKMLQRWYKAISYRPSAKTLEEDMEMCRAIA